MKTVNTRMKSTDVKLIFYATFYYLQTFGNGEKVGDQYVEVHALSLDECKFKLNNAYGRNRYANIYFPEQWESIKHYFPKRFKLIL